MSISPAALAAKKVIEAAWLHGVAYDLASQAAFALESAQMLMAPETAAELERLRTRAAELEEQVAALRAQGDVLRGVDGITRRIAPTQALRESEDVTPQVQKLRNLLAGQRTAVEDDPHGLHHTYRVGRDLPEMGGA